jgi:hypothetical protein
MGGGRLILVLPGRDNKYFCLIIGVNLSIASFMSDRKTAILIGVNQSGGGDKKTRLGPWQQTGLYTEATQYSLVTREGIKD